MMTKREALILWKKLELSDQPVDVGDGLWSKTVDILPPWASYVLDHYNQHNRNDKESSATKYAGDMLAGRWCVTHEGIAFRDTTTPHLADGQNRLIAVRDTGVPIRSMVTVGVSEQATAVIDTCCIRTAMDAAIIAGVYDPDEFGWLSKYQFAIVKNIERGYGHLTQPVSNPESLELANSLKAPLKWMAVNVPLSDVTKNALLLAAIARCYMYGCAGNNQKIHLLKVFCETLGDGQYNGKDPIAYNAYRFREKLLREKKEGKRSSWGNQNNFYNLIEWLLAKTIAGTKIVNIVSPKVKEEMFPSPEEVAAEVAA
jgi:hypothetical protein